MTPCPHRRPWYLHPTDELPSHWWCALRDTVCTEEPETCVHRRDGEAAMQGIDSPDADGSARCEVCGGPLPCQSCLTELRCDQ